MSSNKKIQTLIRKLMLEGYGKNNSPNYFHAALIATDPSAAEIIRNRIKKKGDASSASKLYSQESMTKTSLDVAKNIQDNIVLNSLADDNDIRVVRAVAENINTSQETLRRLADSIDIWVRSNVANNPNTPAEVIAMLAEDPSDVVRYAVASSSAAPSDLLNKLAGSSNENDARLAAKNKNTASHVLLGLANHTDEGVRVFLAMNVNLPQEAFKILANDKSVHVRSKIAANPSAPREVLIRLSKNDRSKRVRDIAMHQLHEGGITESRRLAHRILREIKRVARS